MLPDTTSVEVRDGVVHWENTEFLISVAEAETVAAAVRDTLDDPGVDSIIVDNSQASGTWPSETDAVWDELMADIYAAGLDCATICPSVTNALHINRLSEDNGTHDRIRAFEPDEEDAAYEFVGIAAV